MRAEQMKAIEEIVGSLEKTGLFSTQKLRNNLDLIQQVAIIAACGDGKLALLEAERIAEEADKEVETVKAITDSKLFSARQELLEYKNKMEKWEDWEADLKRRQKYVEDREKSLEKQEAELLKKEDEINKIASFIKDCETPESRDQIRKALFFEEKTKRDRDTREKGAEERHTRGLSNILGSFGRNTISETAPEEPVEEKKGKKK